MYSDLSSFAISLTSLCFEEKCRSVLPGGNYVCTLSTYQFVAIFGTPIPFCPHILK